MNKPNLIKLIDALLPQTQCTQCSYQGCRPYAEAIANGEAINKCPPGGAEVIKALAALLDKPVIALEAEEATPAQVAYIREAECIGCTKCIQACPVDAIVGAAKLMHTVIQAECTGCELCVTPCPVDCIDILSLPPTLTALTGDSAHTEQQRLARQTKRDHARRRFEFRKKRITRLAEARQAERQAKLQQPDAENTTSQLGSKQAIINRVKAQKDISGQLTAEQKRLKIALAIAQVALKKAEKQFQQYNSTALQQQVELLKSKVDEAQQLFDNSLHQ